MKKLILLVLMVLAVGCGGGGHKSGVSAYAPSPDINDSAKIPPSVPVI